MRPGQQNKRGRGRGNNNGGSNNNNNGNNNNNFNRKGGNPLTRTYDSSGPDVKIRGTAQHIAEKYAQLARDAQSSGDRVMAENYLQHAEHYNRIIASAQAQMQERFQREDRSDYQDREALDRDGDDGENGDFDDVVVVQPPRQQHNNGNGNHQQPRREEPRREEQRREEPRVQPEHQARRNDEQPREPAYVAQVDDQPMIAEQPQRAPQSPRPGRPRRTENRPAPAQETVAADGSGPQPDIDGIPAEVAMGEETGSQPRERQPRRRATGPRQRRPRIGEDGEAAADAGSSEPALADVTSE